MADSYTKGMVDGSKEEGTQGFPGAASRNSKWALFNKQPAEALSGSTATGKFIPVDLADVMPPNQTKLNPYEGDMNQ